jgi:hypothetical protein
MTSTPALSAPSAGAPFDTTRSSSDARYRFVIDVATIGQAAPQHAS